MPGHQVFIQLPDEFPKYPLHPIASDGITKSPPHHNPDPTWKVICFISHEIEYIGRESTSLALHPFDIPARPQINALSTWLWHDQIDQMWREGLAGNRTQRRHVRPGGGSATEPPRTQNGEKCPLDGQSGAPFRSTTGENLASVFRAHSFAKAMFTLPL